MKSLFHLLRSRWPLLIPAGLLDGLCIIGFFILHGKTFEAASSRIIELTAIMQESTLEASSTVQLNRMLSESVRFQELYGQVLTLMGVLVLGAFLLWIVFHGAATYLNFRIAGEKHSYWRFLGKWSWLSALYGLALLAVAVLSVRLTAAAFAPLPVIGERLAGTLVFLLLAVVGYFMLISFALIPEQQTLRRSLKLAVSPAAKSLIPRYLGSLALLIVLSLNVIFFAKLHLLAGIAAFIVLFLPGISIARLLVLPHALAAARQSSAPARKPRRAVRKR